jgi:tetratricopeptide (TPR) repeat protein
MVVCVFGKSIQGYYWEMPEQRDKAMIYARYCMDMSARAHRLHGLCACTHLVGDVYTQMGKLDSAAIYIQQSLKLLETQPDLPGLVTVYLAMSRLEEKKQHYDLEEKWLQKALLTQKKYPNGVSEEEQTNRRRCCRMVIFSGFTNSF